MHLFSRKSKQRASLATSRSRSGRFERATILGVHYVPRALCRAAFAGLAIALIASLCPLVVGVRSTVADDASAASRVADDIRFLAADEREGRGPGTRGLEEAGDYIRDTFQRLGLRGGMPDGSYRQPFRVPVDARTLSPQATLTLRGPAGQAWTLKGGRDFQALLAGSPGKATAPLVFVGYGISAPELGYDDFAGVDVARKILVIFRYEPQQDDPTSRFDGKRMTRHAYISTKLAQAKRRGAAAVLLVNPPFTTATQGGDSLSAPNAFGSALEDVPFVQISQTVIDRVLATAPLRGASDAASANAATSDARPSTTSQTDTSPTDTPQTDTPQIDVSQTDTLSAESHAVETPLADARSAGAFLATTAAVERRIDAALHPVSQPLAGWTAELETAFERGTARTANIVGVLDGDGPAADETIVLGAHYDHVGRGEFASRAPNSHQIHNGADDNASGTAALLELARRLAGRSHKPSRRLVFIGFSGEEKGLVGSKHYVAHPLFPLADTIAMLNFDMVGRLRDNQLFVYSVDSADEFSSFLDSANRDQGLNIKKVGDSPPQSDHYSFYERGIPVLHFFTGLTTEYHTPADDFETINVPGVVRTIDYAERVLDLLLAASERPHAIGGPGVKHAVTSRPYLGVTLDDAPASEGLRIKAVMEKSAAAEGGLEPGDVILRLGNFPVSDLASLQSGLLNLKPGDKVEIMVRREQQSVTCTVTLRRSPGS